MSGKEQVETLIRLATAPDILRRPGDVEARRKLAGEIARDLDKTAALLGVVDALPKCDYCRTPAMYRRREDFWCEKHWNGDGEPVPWADALFKLKKVSEGKR